MDRRSFIRLAGGGVVVAVAAGTASASLLSSAMPEEAIVDWRGPAATEPDPRRWALAHAILAPNPHNRQPWLVDLREANTITLYCDPNRLLPHTDPLGRQILIGHGCFLELLTIALAERGFASELTLFPEGEVGATLADISSKPIARIRLQYARQPDPLFAQILKRHTPKEAFDLTRAIPADAIEAMRTSVSKHDVQFGVTSDAARVSALRAIAMEAARIELETEPTMMESMRLIRIGPREIAQHRDGISLNTPFVRFASTVGLFNRDEFPKPGSTGHKQAIARYQKFTQTAPAFVWLSTSGNTRSQQLNVGRAYVRMQLAATTHRVGVHPLSQALQEFPEMRPQYDHIHQALLGEQAKSATVQMFCRIGFPVAEIGPTPRRGVNAIIRG
jgi:hypothetical protein